MMSATIITLADRRPQTEPQIQPQLDANQAYLGRLFAAPTYKALPFVTLKDPAERTGGFGDASSWWNDVPTDDSGDDYHRGRDYAKMAVAAIVADHCHPRALEMTFEDIFLDAVRRRDKKGKYSRSLTSCAQGFLAEIAIIIGKEVKS